MVDPVAPAASFAELTAFLKEQREELKAERMSMEAKLEQQRLALEARLDAEREKMRAELMVSSEQLASLQSRLEALYVAKLLSNDEIETLEGLLADYFAMGSSSTLVQLVRVSEGFVTDASFARQARRKFCHSSKLTAFSLEL
eukprot:SAG31_NODE_440_length_15664_cov_8.209252_12_plen_143_part_00